MTSIPHPLARLGSWPMFRFDLIQHDVPDRDAGWFARCRVQQFANFPWFAGDAMRGLLSVWLLVPAPGIALSMTLLGIAAVWLAAIFLRRWLARPVANPERRLAQIQAFLILRGAVWAGIAATLVCQAGTNKGVVVFFALGPLLFDMVAMLSLPLVGLAVGTLLVLGMAVGLLCSGDVDPLLVAAASVMAVVGLHYTLFNLYHLFATRRLRTRRLLAANETIQSLLSQYDEHGADAIMEVDCDGRLDRPSPRLCEMLGRTSAELDGLNISSLFEPGPERSAMLGAARRLQRFRNHVVPVGVDGKRRWWSVSGCAMFDGQGRHQGFRCFAQDVTEQRANEERVHVMATRDNLTGLLNRAMFTARLNDLLDGKRERGNCSVLFIDLDHFKLVNDTYGHAAGDAVLIEAARRIEALLEPDMMAARLGGDEFAVLAWNVASASVTSRLADAIVAELARPIIRDGVLLPSGGSIGIALGLEHGRTNETLLRAADIALYEAKSRGRGQSVLFEDGLLHKMQERRDLEVDLRSAMDRGEFALYYQPLIDIASRRTIGYEALLRWHHPSRGPVPPATFVPLAEETGLIVAIGEWALREALREAATWQEHLSISVNVSPAQMRGESLFDHVMAALTATGVAPRRLELEITETALMERSEEHLRILHRLRALGVRIALDDFGTGYSSLTYLRSFPFDKLKVDRSFVNDIVEEPDSHAIVRSVVSLAREFGMKTTAEGIESEAQLTRLRSMGCTQAQGFLFAQPLPAASIPATHRGRTWPGPAAKEPQLSKSRVAAAS
jgi:diguanylate cyclase (GGDEF)-like protein/PAS domain S-box-containing protein